MAAITWRNSRNRPATKQQSGRLLRSSEVASDHRSQKLRGPAEVPASRSRKQWSGKSLDAPWPESGRRLLSKGTRTLPARLHLESLG
ncbi:hypothetical protein WJX84_000519 [Apatococcus fuscideae]|uniref:Uncharacterized protein n=1 Tax=Apatococcus fuscideae TaxID=2026836 RepID=A0AAW1T2B4_9CHLO